MGERTAAARASYTLSIAAVVLLAVAIFPEALWWYSIAHGGSTQLERAAYFRSFFPAGWHARLFERWNAFPHGPGRLESLQALFAALALTMAFGAMVKGVAGANGVRVERYVTNGIIVLLSVCVILLKGFQSL